MGSVLVGCLCPLVGSVLCPPTHAFPGVALRPALSRRGIALAFLLYRMLVGQHQRFMRGERWLALLGSLSCTLVGLLVLAALARHRETVEARMASPMRLPPLLRSVRPWIRRRRHMVNLLKGDILATTGPSLSLMAGIRRCSMPADGLS